MNVITSRSDFNRVIAEYSIAPFRIGLTATPDRGDDRHKDLDWLIGIQVYHRTPDRALRTGARGASAYQNSGDTYR